MQIREALEAYRDGKIGFAVVARMPDWRRLALAAKRRQRRVCPDWVEEADVIQEALLAVHKAARSHETPTQALDRLIVEMTMEAWPREPDLSFLSDENYIGPKRSDIEKYVAAQIYWFVRNYIREASKIPHKRGATAPKETPVSALVRVGSTTEMSVEQWFAQRGASAEPEQESELARKRAIGALPARVRASVDELYESGSVEKAFAKFADRDRPRWEMAAEIAAAAGRVVEEVSL